MEKQEKVKADGILLFNPNEKAPDFVKGSLVITPNKLIAWLKDNKQYLTEYNGNKQLKLQILEGNTKDGDAFLYANVDTWKPTEKVEVAVEAEADPF